MNDLDELLAGLDNPRASRMGKSGRTPSAIVDYDELNVLMRDLAAPSTVSVQVSASTPAPKAKQQPEPRSSNFYSNTSTDDLDDLLESVTRETTPANRNTQQPVRSQPARASVQPAQQAAPQARNTKSADQMDDLDELLRNLGPPSTHGAPVPAPQPVSYNPPTTYNNPPPAFNPAPQPVQHHPPASYERQSQSPNAGVFAHNATRQQQPQAPRPAVAKPAGRALDGPDLDLLLADINKTSIGNMNSGGPASRGDCAHCHKAILGEVIQALNKTYHPEHFMCGNCSSPLGTSNFYEQDGMPNCERCYQELFCARCAHCDEPITGRCVTALNRKWHQEHFICTQCLGPFAGGTFFEKEGRPYCDNCFHNAFSSRCAGCNQAIRGECINALGSQWHPEHFVCNYCQKSFGGGSFYEYGGKPYCETHYHQQTGSLCAGCGKAVTGRVINALEKKWHPEHFVCSFCMQPLAGGAFTENGGKAYCKECHGKLFG